jgi:hypothetical protein
MTAARRALLGVLSLVALVLLVASPAARGGSLQSGAHRYHGRFVSAAEAGDTAATTVGREVTTYYPPNRGFLGNPVKQTLETGTRIDRYGGERVASSHLPRAPRLRCVRCPREPSPHR